MKKTLFFLTMLSLTLTVRAQWDVQFSDYTSLKSFYNPATSGTDGLLNVNAAYSMQFAGFDNAPQTMYVGADMPVYFLSPRHGAGLSFMNDKFGIFSTKKVALQYAFNMAIGKKKRTRVAIGLQGAVLSENIDPSQLDTDEGTTSSTSDPAFPTSQVDGTAFDMGAGVYVYNPNFWGGLSALHLMSPLIELGDRYEVQIDPVYYFMGGCNIKIKNTLFTITPSLMVMTDCQSWREDVQCRVSYEYEGRRFYLGAGYSPDISTTVMVGGVFHGIGLGYSYQIYTQGLSAVNGSHELVLTYQTDLDLFKKGKNSHKSIRFL